MKSQSEMLQEFIEHGGKEYQKFGDFEYEVNLGEPFLLTTTFYNEKGEVEESETQKMCKTGDVIIMGVSGERYVLNPKQFANRYRIHNDFYAEAVRKGYAYQYQGENTSFEAPWNEEMQLKNGDYLFSPDCQEVYRIREAEFNLTYKLVENAEN